MKYLFSLLILFLTMMILPWVWAVDRIGSEIGYNGLVTPPPIDVAYQCRDGDCWVKNETLLNSEFNQYQAKVPGIFSLIENSGPTLDYIKSESDVFQDKTVNHEEAAYLTDRTVFYGVIPIS